MAEQPGTTPERLQTGWYTVHQSSCSSSFALQRHLLRYDTGIESRVMSSCMVVHVDVQLKPSHLLRWSTDGRAAGHGPAATPHQLVHSASLGMTV